MMDDELVDTILNMYKTPEPFKIVMPVPTIRKHVKKDSSMLDKQLDFDKPSSKESETEYAKEYVRKEEEEYIRVISIKICNNITVCICLIFFLLFFTVEK